MTRQEIEITMYEYYRHKDLTVKAEKAMSERNNEIRQLETRLAQLKQMNDSDEKNLTRWRATYNKAIDNIADQFPGLVVTLGEKE